MQAEKKQATAADLSGPDAFADAVRPFWSDMAWLARKLAPAGLWEDVLQDALGTAWRMRARYDPARGSLRTWLFAVVADQSRKSARKLRPTSDIQDVAGAAVDHDADVDLTAAMAQLTTRQQTALTLHYYLGLNVTDTATVMSCRPGTVKSTLHDARQRLRRILGEDYRNA